MGLVGMEGGAPIVMAGNGGTNDNLLGGGLGGLLLGGLLFGQNGMMGGINRGYSMNGGYGMGGYDGGYGRGGALGGYVVGNDQGVQSAGIAGIKGQVDALAATVASNAINSQIENLGSQLESGLDSVRSEQASIARDMSNGLANNLNAVTNGNFTTLNSINGLGRDVTAQANNNALQQLNSFNVLGTNINQGFNATGAATQAGFNSLSTNMLNGFNQMAFNNQASFNSLGNAAQQGFNVLNTSIMQGFNEVNRDANIATSQIIAGQNALASNMAHCCCEIKEKISLDGQLTRTLINDVRLSELNAALTDAKLANSNLHQTNALINNNAAQTSVILSHLNNNGHNNHHGRD